MQPAHPVPIVGEVLRQLVGDAWTAADDASVLLGCHGCGFKHVARDRTISTHMLQIVTDKVIGKCKRSTLQPFFKRLHHVRWRMSIVQTSSKLLISSGR